jgi:ATP-binding cassette subfamily C protein
MLGVLPSFLTAFSSVFLLIVGGLRVMDGHLSIGMLTAFQSLSSSFQAPINSLVSFGSTLQELEGNLIRLDAVLTNPIDPEVENRKREFHWHHLEAKAQQGALRLRGDVQLQNITFGYSRVSPPLIENFNLSIQPGQRVALVGSSGSGKSTIAKLVCGLYQPWTGEILFDGEPRRQIHQQILMTSIAMVEQEVLMFEGTIRENLSLWDATLLDKNLVRACQGCRHL